MRFLFLEVAPMALDIHPELGSPQE